jgi:hypothetical protein
VTFSDGVSISSAETYPTIAEAMTAAALKLLDMPERLERLDRSEISGPSVALCSSGEPQNAAALDARRAAKQS